MSTTIIAIAGASGSGKTRLAERLMEAAAIQSAGDTIALIHEDTYYHDLRHLGEEERATQNFDHPNAFDHALLTRHLEMLKQGETIDTPIYDYHTHLRTGGTRRVNAAALIVLEGILVLHDPALRALCETKIFVDTPLDICLGRRMQRDINERGRTPDSVLTQYHDFVRPMYFEFIAPSREHADILVPHGGENDVAVKLLSGLLPQ